MSLQKCITLERNSFFKPSSSTIPANTLNFLSSLIYALLGADAQFKDITVKIQRLCEYRYRVCCMYTYYHISSFKYTFYNC